MNEADDVYQEPEPESGLRWRGVALLAVLAAPMIYSCIVPLADGLHRANPIAVVVLPLVFGMAFVAPLAYLLGPFGALSLIQWFWKSAISRRDDAALLLKVWAFGVYFTLFVSDVGVLCSVSPAFLAFLNAHFSWIGDLMREHFGP
jgi:hypothetical protein